MYIKLANYRDPISILRASLFFFSPACISYHSLASYHSGKLSFLIPWISTGQESRPPFMHRNQFSHHYTLHQNNVLRAKVEAGGNEPKHLFSKRKHSGIFKGKENKSPRLSGSPRNGESLMAQSVLIQIWNLVRLCAQRKVLIASPRSALL